MHEGSPGAFEQLHLCGMSRRGYLGLMDGVTKALGTIFGASGYSRLAPVQAARQLLDMSSILKRSVDPSWLAPYTFSGASRRHHAQYPRVS